MQNHHESQLNMNDHKTYDMQALPPNHFLSQARSFTLPGSFSDLAGPSKTSSYSPFHSTTNIDTSTLAAHDFDVDARTGFMPPQAPLARLPDTWVVWEDTLDDACSRRLQLATKPNLTSAEAGESATWRNRVHLMPIVSTTGITGERTLRRAHHVLAWLMHFYVHTLPSDAPILIPAPISRPLLSVCAILKLPPVLTYSDDVLYNWTFKTPSPSPPPQPVASTVAGYPPWLAGVATSTTATTQQPTPSNIMIQTTFTGTSDEAEFYLASARIELVGVQALSLLSSIADEAFLGDTIALTRITTHLHSLATVIAEMSSTLLAVREGCDPHVFYDEIRPWFKGEDAAPGARKWVFEGATAEDNVWTAELSGPSAGQSALIHALDVFLGVASETHGAGLTGRHGPPHGSSHGHGHDKEKEKEKEQSAATTGIKTHNKPFLERMQAYMPRHHRAFLTHLGASPTPLRALVQQHGLSSLSPNPLLTAAYDDAVRRLKEFRDAHMRIVAIYIVGPARRAAEREAERARWDAESQEGRWLGPKEATDEQLPYDEGLKGTGGTELVRFLKSVRDRTAGSVLGAKI